MQPNKLAIGDTFTIDGVYAKRSLMQWLKREPKKLQQMVVKAHTESFTEYEKCFPDKIDTNPQKA